MPGCASSHALRAAWTSSRSCSLACSVFFEGEIPLVQLVPERADLDRNASFGQSKLQLGQGEIGLGRDPGAQHRLRLRQPRLPVAADPKAATLSRRLHSVAHLVDPDAAHLEPPRNLGRTVSAIQRPQHPLPQILRIGLHRHLPQTTREVSHKLYMTKLEML